MILLDSNMLIAYADEDDECHKQAVAIVTAVESGKYGKAVVLDLVFSEVMTVLALKAKNKPVALKFAEIIKAAYGIAFSDETLFLRALEIFKERPRLSFADSALFAYAGLHGAEHIASFDREFKKVPGAKIVC